MSSNLSTSVRSSNSTALFTGFLGAFIVGSLGVQLVRSQNPVFQAESLKVQPVIAHQSTLWASLGEKDFLKIKNKVSSNQSIRVIPVVGSEATLWSPLGGN